MKYRTQYEQFERTDGIEFKDKTLAKQEFRDECNINNIMKRFQKTGILPDMIKENPVYGDFSEPLDYQEALNIVIAAEHQFMGLNAEIRERFGNDPKKFLEFCHNPENADEMEKLGLLSEEAVEKRVKARETAQAARQKESEGGTPPSDRQPKGGRSDQAPT